MWISTLERIRHIKQAFTWNGQYKNLVKGYLWRFRQKKSGAHKGALAVPDFYFLFKIKHLNWLSSPAFAPFKDTSTFVTVRKLLKLKPKGFFLVQIRPSLIVVMLRSTGHFIFYCLFLLKYNSTPTRSKHDYLFIGFALYRHSEF